MGKLVVVCLFSVIVSPCMSMQDLGDMGYPREKIAMAEGIGKEKMNLAGKYNELVDDFNRSYQTVQQLLLEKGDLDSKIEAKKLDIENYENMKMELDGDLRRWEEEERNLKSMLGCGFELTPKEKETLSRNNATCAHEIELFVNKFYEELTRNLPGRFDFKIHNGCLSSSGFTCSEKGRRVALKPSTLAEKICDRVYLSVTEGEEIEEMEKAIKKKSDKVYALEIEVTKLVRRRISHVSQQRASQIVCKNILKIFGGDILGSEMERYAQVFADEKITDASLMRAMARDESVKTEDGTLCVRDDVTGYLFSYKDIAEWLRVVCENK